MANDFRLLNEVYQKSLNEDTDNVQQLNLDFENNQIPHMITLVNRLEGNTGVAFYDRPSGTHGGIFVERIRVSLDESKYRIGGWGDKHENIRRGISQKEAVAFAVKLGLQRTRSPFKYYEIYDLLDDEGESLRTSFVNPAPYGVPRDIEPYGPEPGPQMQDLQ